MRRLIHFFFFLSKQGLQNYSKPRLNHLSTLGDLLSQKKVNVASFELFTYLVHPDQPGGTHGSAHPGMTIVELQKEACVQGDVLKEGLSDIWVY